MLWFKLGAMLAIIALITYGGYSYNHALEKARDLEHDNKVLSDDLKASGELLKKEQARTKRLNVTLAQKVKDDQKLKADTEKLIREIQELGSKNPDANAWLNSPVPNDIVNCLRQHTCQIEPAEGDMPRSTPGPDGPNSGGPLSAFK